MRALRAAVALLLLVALSGCADGGSAAQGDVLPSTPLPADQDPGLVHVHGLGVNPADGRVYAATHFGLWRFSDDGEPERVGEMFHDLMGFTIVGPDHFLASGHPLLTEDLPPLLGLIESTDAGQTWRSVSLLGDADFHVLREAHDAVWGWASGDGALMVSDDGLEWQVRSSLTTLLDFAVDPDDPEHLLAGAADGPGGGGMQRSRDGGRTWEPADGPVAARLAWEDGERLWAAAVDGAVWRSRDRGVSWEQAGDVGARPEAFADTGNRLLVAAGVGIAESVDDGRTWRQLHGGP